MVQHQPSLSDTCLNYRGKGPRVPFGVASDESHAIRVTLRGGSGETDDKGEPIPSKQRIDETPGQPAVAVREGMEREQRVA